VAAVERAGGVRRRGRGAHVNVKMPNGQLVMIRKAGLDEEEFLILLGRKR
jgi:hypothetical protein